MDEQRAEEHGVGDGLALPDQRVEALKVVDRNRYLRVRRGRSQVRSQTDAEDLTAALGRTRAAEGFLSAASPGVISLFFRNTHYPTHEAYLAAIAEAMRQRGLDSAHVAHFLDRVVFCLFAEDVRLLPNGVFAKLVEATKDRPDQFTLGVRGLFGAMATSPC